MRGDCGPRFYWVIELLSDGAGFPWEPDRKGVGANLGTLSGKLGFEMEKWKRMTRF